MDLSYKNIILLTIDCLRFDFVTPLITPNLWDLAKEGHFYTNAWSEYGHTINSFQTLWKREWIYALKKRNYYTMGITYNAYLSRKFGYDSGFDYFHDIMSRETTTPFIDDSMELNQLCMRKLMDGIYQPFFCWLHYMDCHAPYYPHTWDKEMMLADCGAPLVEITPKIIKRIKSKYQFAITYLDHNIGIFLKFLKKRRLYDDTIIIVSADHGEEFYEKGRFGHDAKRTCEEVLHIPLIVKGHGKGLIEKKVLFRDISTIILNS